MHVVSSAEALNWTGYIYGGLAHASHLRYDQRSEIQGETSVRRGLRRIGIHPDTIAGWTVMDVGTGLYSLGFHRLGATVEHRDISSNTVQALRNYAAERGLTRLRSCRTDLGNDPLPERHFDLIYLSGVFQHLAEPARTLANLARALKPGGRLYVDFYRSGRWRWFVIDVLRKIAQPALLHPVLSRFTECCALGDRWSVHLRQVELLIDDVFVEHLHLFRPSDLTADAETLDLQPITPATSMDLLDPGDAVDHSLFYAHVFNTLGFCKGDATGAAAIPDRTRGGRCQVSELERLDDAYHEIVSLTAEFVLAHQSGRFSEEATASHIANLFRMAHPCLPGDPYLEPGEQEPLAASATMGNRTVADRRHARWCTFLANVLNRPDRSPGFALESLGYELIRFVP